MTTAWIMDDLQGKLRGKKKKTLSLVVCFHMLLFSNGLALRSLPAGDIPQGSRVLSEKSH